MLIRLESHNVYIVTTAEIADLGNRKDPMP